MPDHQLPYSAVEILRYLKGEMTAREMHRLERQALEDPMLREALEGYEQALSESSDPRLMEALDRAMHAGQKNQEKQKGIVVPFWRNRLFQYAVASCLVLGAGWLIFQWSYQDNLGSVGETASTKVMAVPDSGPNPLMHQETPPPPPVAEAKDAMTTKEIRNSDPTPKTAPQEDPREVTASAQEKIRTSGDAAAATIAPQSDPPVAQVSGRKSVPGGQQGLARSAAPAAAMASEPRSFTVQGQTVDEEGNPVEYVRLKNREGKLVGQSDALGRFTIIVPDSVTSLTAEAVGYEKKEVMVIAAAPKNVLSLTPEESSLEEMVVSGLAKQKSAPRRSLVNLTLIPVEPRYAEPTGGWPALERYLQGYLSAPTIDEVPKGTVTLQFFFTADGMPRQVTVVKSNNKVLEPLLEKALIEGPAWKMDNPNDARATITIDIK